MSLLGLAWLAVTLVVMVVGFRQAIFIAPTEATMGNVQRIFYYHVPHAIWALMFPYLNLAGSVAFLYLRRRNPLAALKADAWAIATAEVTVVYTSICLATGMLWGKAVWGIWWAWDARLTSLLLLWLLYVAYLMTRRLSATGQTSTVGAVIKMPWLARTTTDASPICSASWAPRAAESISPVYSSMKTMSPSNRQPVW